MWRSLTNENFRTQTNYLGVCERDSVIDHLQHHCNSERCNYVLWESKHRSYHQLGARNSVFDHSTSSTSILQNITFFKELSCFRYRQVNHFEHYYLVSGLTLCDLDRSDEDSFWPLSPISISPEEIVVGKRGPLDEIRELKICNSFADAIAYVFVKHEKNSEFHHKTCGFNRTCTLQPLKITATREISDGCGIGSGECIDDRTVQPWSLKYLSINAVRRSLPFVMRGEGRYSLLDKTKLPYLLREHVLDYNVLCFRNYSFLLPEHVNLTV
jgi:hypothetical protein